jgi:hypothetical protein
MLQIVIALSAASPIVLGHRLVLVFRFWARTVFRLALGFSVAIFGYFAVLFVVVESYSLSQPLGPAVYGGGFVLATLLGVIAGTLVSPARLSRLVIPGTCALALVFPIGLNVYLGVVADWRPAYLLYLLGSICGGYAVTRLTSPRSRGIPRYCHI